jgi:excisionase family DNA binding protein
VSSLLLKPLEVAELLGLSRSKVFEMLAAEELPVVRIGRAVRIPRSDLDAWVRSRTKCRSLPAGSGASEAPVTTPSAGLTE